VTQAVGQMDEVTQQNAALVEEAAAAAESLEEQAQALVRSVAMFRLSEGNAGNGAAPARPSVKASVSSLPVRSAAKLQKVGAPVSKFKTGTAASLAEDHWESF
jgi:methyl-accepting chemotaxis protein